LATVASAAEVTDIVVEGNTKTTTDTVEVIARISTGDDWNNDKVAEIKERLRSSGLFSKVEAFFEDDKKHPGGIRVHLMVEDKHSWVIAPAFYDQPTNTGGGVGYGENNLFGTNQKLLLYGQLATGDSFFVGAWVIPNLGGTRFYTQFDTYLDTSRVIEYASPTKYLDDPKAVRQSRMNYLNGGWKLGVELFRGIKLDGRIRAAHVAYTEVERERGATTEDILGPGADPSAPIPKPGKEGWDISNEWQLTIDRRANWEGVYTGHKYVLDYEWSGSQIGSDFHYHRYGVSLWRGIKVLEHHNLVLKGNFQTGHYLPFQQELATGGTSMRGYLNAQFRGDFQALANIEYSFPLFEILGLSMRGMAFYDSAYTTFLTTTNPDRNYLPYAQVRGLDGFKNSVGLGTRFYLKQVVIPLLGVDVGYGLETGDIQVYLAIGLTD
jgi:outer membrane protein assembly factor BamA